MADIQAKLPTHELVILTKFHKDYEKIVDFLLRRTFLACALFYSMPFIFKEPILFIHLKVFALSILSPWDVNNVEMLLGKNCPILAYVIL